MALYSTTNAAGGVERTEVGGFVLSATRAIEASRSAPLLLTARVGRCVAAACAAHDSHAPLVRHWFTQGIGLQPGLAVVDRLSGLGAGTSVTDWADSRQILWGDPQIVTNVAYNSDECTLEPTHFQTRSLCCLNMIHSPNADTPTDISCDIRVDVMQQTPVPPHDLPVSVQPQWCRALMRRCFTPPTTAPGEPAMRYEFAYRWDAADLPSLLTKRKEAEPACEVALTVDNVQTLTALEFGHACNALIARATHLLHPGPHQQRYMLFEQSETRC